LVENQPAPADRRVWPEALALRDQGFQVSIISPKGTTKCRESHVCIDGIHIYRYRLPGTGHKYVAYFAEYGVAVLKTFWLSLKVLFVLGFNLFHAANQPDIFFRLAYSTGFLGRNLFLISMTCPLRCSR